MEQECRYQIRLFNPQTDKLILNQAIGAYQKLMNEPENLKQLSFTGIPFTKEQIQEWFQTADKKKVVYFISVQEAIHGFCAVKENPLEGLELVSLIVDNETRCQGIGTDLIHAAISYAKQKGYSVLDTSVYADNSEMLKLLILLEFIPIRMEYHIRYDGADRLVLRKTI